MFIKFVKKKKNLFFETQYTLAMMGYAEEKETTVLELTYNYGVTEYTKGNAYAQVNLFPLLNARIFYRKNLMILNDDINYRLQLVQVMCIKVVKLLIMLSKSLVEK